MRRVYAGQVTYLDYEIGRVLDHFDELDLTLQRKYGFYPITVITWVTMVS